MLSELARVSDAHTRGLTHLATDASESVRL
jgi:hypothetical protein